MQPQNGIATEYYLNGMPEIDPFKGINSISQFDNGFFRTFHQLPTHPYDLWRMKYKEKVFNKYYENDRNIFTPINSFEDIKIFINIKKFIIKIK